MRSQPMVDDSLQQAEVEQASEIFLEDGKLRKVSALPKRLTQR